MISTMNLNFRHLFLDDSARGGWDIEVDALPTNLFPTSVDHKHGPLGEALDRQFYDTLKIDAIAEVGLTNPRTVEMAQVRDDGTLARDKPFLVLAASPIFLEQNDIELQARAAGYPSDEAVWEAVRVNGDLAVIDGSVVPGINYANVTEGRLTLDGFESGTTTFDPIDIELTNSASDATKRVRIIGIMSRAPSETFRGLWLNADSAIEVFPTLAIRYYIRLVPGADPETEAERIEQALSENGVEAISIENQIAENQELNNAFFYLIQGFLALGLGVGLAALAVIALRTVVERRQQIGLMRAIGFSRTNVALTFLLESAFIAFLGIINGIWPALLLASRLLSSEEFSTAGFSEFYIPWMQIGIVAALVFVAAVLTTVVPSRQASSIPIAEALRYE
jgi:putative ABC transport system permease protein